MARSRTRRRRRSALAGAALVLTLSVLIFAHDVLRAARTSPGAQRSEAASFATLATTVVADDTATTVDWTRLLTAAPTMGRSTLLAKLTVLREQVGALRNEIVPLESPTVAGGVSRQFVTLATARTRAFDNLLALTAGALQLPWPRAATGSVATDEGRLAGAAQAWRSTVLRLHRSADGATLPLFAATNVATQTAQLLALPAQPKLVVVHRLTIAAVIISPSPFPAPLHVIELIPVSSFSVGVSVANQAAVTEAVRVDVSLTSATAGTRATSRTLTIGATSAAALSGLTFDVTPGQRYTLRVRVTGLTDSVGAAANRTYHVIVASA